jgi:hypothetical protein
MDTPKAESDDAPVGHVVVEEAHVFDRGPYDGVPGRVEPQGLVNDLAGVAELFDVVGGGPATGQHLGRLGPRPLLHVRMGGEKLKGQGKGARRRLVTPEQEDELPGP